MQACNDGMEHWSSCHPYHIQENRQHRWLLLRPFQVLRNCVPGPMKRRNSRFASHEIRDDNHTVAINISYVYYCCLWNDWFICRNGYKRGWLSLTRAAQASFLFACFVLLYSRLCLFFCLLFSSLVASVFVHKKPLNLTAMVFQATSISRPLVSLCYLQPPGQGMRKDLEHIRQNWPQKAVAF